MNQGAERSRALRWIVLSALAIILLLAAGAFRGWNNRNRPQWIVGDWILDDLRTEGDEASLVTFHATGLYDGDPAFAARWHSEDGLIYVRCWQNDNQWAIGRSLIGTTVYSWLVEADDEFPLVPEFNEDRSIMTLAFPGKQPHVSLHRRSATDRVDRRTKR